jgi:hypothetical protein
MLDYLISSGRGDGMDQLALIVCAIEPGMSVQPGWELAMNALWCVFCVLAFFTTGILLLSKKVSYAGLIVFLIGVEGIREMIQIIAQ